MIHAEHFSTASAEIYTAVGQINLWKKKTEREEKGGILGRPFSLCVGGRPNSSLLCRMNSHDIRWLPLSIFFFLLAGCHRFPAAIFNREKYLYMPIAVTIGVFKNKRSLRSCLSPCICSYLYIFLCNISSPCHCIHHIKTKKTGL